MGAVAGLCRRALWINEGRIGADGGVDDVMDAYLNSLSESGFVFENPDYGLKILGVTLRNGGGEATTRFAPGEDLIFEMDYDAARPISRPYVLLVVQGAQGPCFTANMLLDGQRPGVLEGRGRLSCRFRSIPLLPQTYAVRFRMVAAEGRESVVALQEVASFTVEWNTGTDSFQGERFHFHASRSTPVIVPYEWILPDGSVRPVEIRHREPGAPRVPSGERRRS